MNLTTPTYDELKRQERICMDAIAIHRQLLESHQEQLLDIRARVEQVKKEQHKGDLGWNGQKQITDTRPM